MSEPPSAELRARPKGLWVLALQLILTAALVWFLFDRIGLSLDELGGVDLAAWTPSLLPLVGASLLLLAGHAMSGALWGRLAAELGDTSISAPTAIRIHFVANLGRYIPGKLWQIAGLAILAREVGMRPRISMGSAVLGQGFALVAASVIGLIALQGGSVVPREIGLWMVAASVLTGAIVLTPAVFARISSLWFRLARVERPSDEALRPTFVLRWTGLYLVNWVVYALSFWVFARSFGLPGTLAELAPAFAAAYVVGYAVLIAPAGIGVREASLTALLAPVMGVAAAATLSVVTRLWMSGIELAPAGFLWIRRLQGQISSLRSHDAERDGGGEA